MNKFKYFETESGKKIKTAQFDGYKINDRTFEGLNFLVHIQEDGSLKVNVDPNHEDYFSDFNQEKWLKIATEFAYENDIFEDPLSKEDCWLVSDGNNQNTSQNNAKPITIKAGFGPFSKRNNAQVEKEEKVEQDKEPVIGKFKPNRKFLSFISGSSGARVRFNRETAFIDASNFSGTLDGVKFKITICDEGTINFEEVDTNLVDDSTIERFIEYIDEKDVTGYTQKFVVSGLEFKDEDGNRCYLEVEHQRPIDRFASLLESFEEEEETNENVTLSERGSSLLDALFSSDEEESNEEDEVSEDKEHTTEVKKSASESLLEESFRKMNEDKINELKSRIDNNQKEISRIKSEIKQSENKLEKVIDDTSVLETRLENLAGNEQPIGWVFNVSEEIKSEVDTLTEETEKVVNKIAEIASLKKDVLMSMLTEGYYKIRIAPKDDYESSDFKIDKDVYVRLTSIDPMGKFMFNESESEIEYRGDLNWHQLVSKLIKKGFEQEPEFDKMCNSNSYTDKWKTTDNTDKSEELSNKNADLDK